MSEVIHYGVKGMKWGVRQGSYNREKKRVKRFLKTDAAKTITIGAGLAVATAALDMTIGNNSHTKASDLIKYGAGK